MEMKQFKSKTLKYLFITIIIVYLVASFFIMNAIYHRYYDQEKQSLIELAESARTFMNHDDIKSLEAHFDDTLKPEYQYLKTNLINLKEFEGLSLTTSSKLSLSCLWLTEFATFFIKPKDVIDAI